MMLLRTLVLERDNEEAPVNGALLCGFAVAQTASNFLVYSLDEEAEPGHSRVYIAVLRKKLERYFLSGVDSKEDLQVAMQVFKQILMLAAASGSRTSPMAERYASTLSSESSLMDPSPLTRRCPGIIAAGMRLALPMTPTSALRSAKII